MAEADDDFRQVMQILIDEGFETLAGEILIAVAQRRAGPKVERDDDDEEDVEVRHKADFATPEDLLGDLEFVMDFIHKRLVEPARALAEAERIAGSLTGGPPVEIRFSEAVNGDEIEERGTAPAGDYAAAIDLGRALDNSGDNCGCRQRPPNHASRISRRP